MRVNASEPNGALRFPSFTVRGTFQVHVPPSDATFLWSPLGWELWPLSGLGPDDRFCSALD